MIHNTHGAVSRFREVPSFSRNVPGTSLARSELRQQHAANGTCPTLMEDHPMKAKSLVFAGCAIFALSSNAQAGPCSEQVTSLTKTFASKDAGTGPTTGMASARTTTSQAGQHPPTATMSEQTQGIATSPEDVRRQTAGQLPAGQQQTTGSATEHPPTAAMDQAMQGQAAPPGGQPPTAAMSAATESQMPPRDASAMNAINMPEASMALDRAREFDRQGNEADCMNSIGDAKRLSGAQ